MIVQPISQPQFDPAIKFNKILMIQIAIFATISMKAARARPRAAFHSICRALKNLRQIRNKAHVLRWLSILEEKQYFSSFYKKE